MKKSFLLVPLAIILVMSLFLVSCEDEPEIKTYTVTFLLDEGDAEPFDKKTVLEGAGITDAKVPEKTGHKYLHWKNVGGNDVYELNTPVKGDLTLVAVWETNKYTVSFMDGETKAADPQTVEYGKKATAPTAPTKEGHTFSCWKKVGSSSPFDFAKEVITENTVLEAVWDTNKYTVSFMDGETKASDPQTVEYGKTATAPTAPTKEGHTFNCWRKVESSSPFDFAKEVITEDTVLEAVWDINTYTVTFDYPDGQEDVENKVFLGGKVEIPKDPEPADEKYEFLHWTADAESKEEFKFDATPIEDNLTLYPVFGIKKFTVTFVGAEGLSSAPEPQKVAYGSYSEDPNATATEGYIITGWTKDEGEDTPFDFASSPIMEDIKLYPIVKKY